MNFFIQGRPGIGKSYTIRECLKDYTDITEGFTVQRLYDDEKLWGFRTCVVDHSLEPLDARLDTAGRDGTFISPGGKDLSVLEKVIAQVEKNCLKSSCQIVLLDEIGGFELLSDKFMSSLYEILNSGRLCIGVLKSRQNLKHTIRKRDSNCDKSDELYLNRHDKLQNRLEDIGFLYTMSNGNKETIRERLQTELTMQLCNRESK